MFSPTACKDGHPFVHGIAVSWCGTMTIGWTDYFLPCIAEKCRSVRGVGIRGVRSTVGERIGGFGQNKWEMSKGNENMKELGAHHLSLSSVLISSSLQRQVLNYHYKPESFLQRRILLLFLSVAPSPRLFRGSWWSIREMSAFNYR